MRRRKWTSAAGFGTAFMLSPCYLGMLLSLDELFLVYASCAIGNVASNGILSSEALLMC